MKDFRTQIIIKYRDVALLGTLEGSLRTRSQVSSTQCTSQKVTSPVNLRTTSTFSVFVSEEVLKPFTCTLLLHVAQEITQ